MKRKTKRRYKRGIIIDKIEFVNIGNYEDPFLGAFIEGRYEDDYTNVKLELVGNQAEELQMIIEDYLRKKKWSR